MSEWDYRPLPSRVELRDALELLDRALPDQRARLREARDMAGDAAMLAVLGRSVELMEIEARRLRALVAGDYAGDR